MQVDGVQKSMADALTAALAPAPPTAREWNSSPVGLHSRGSTRQFQRSPIRMLGAQRRRQTDI